MNGVFYIYFFFVRQRLKKELLQNLSIFKLFFFFFSFTAAVFDLIQTIVNPSLIWR